MGKMTKLSFKEYIRELGFLSPTKTKNLLILISVLNFSSANSMRKNTIEDKDKVLELL